RERDDVERNDGEEQRLAEAPHAESPGVSLQESGVLGGRSNAPVRDRLGVLDHPSQMELVRAASSHARKAGPGRTDREPSAGCGARCLSGRSANTTATPVTSHIFKITDVDPWLSSPGRIQ